MPEPRPIPPPHPADIPIPELPPEDFDRIMGEAMKKRPPKKEGRPASSK